MLVSKCKSDFLLQLKGEYPSEEINSFFNLLTEAFLGMSRLDLALDRNKRLNPSEEMKFREAIHRLLDHEPVQYIIGETEFFGLKFRVNKNVLIPRPETEELVQWVLDDLKIQDFDNPSILDIGTGSGCIAITLAKLLPDAAVTAIDISSEALQIAKTNAELNNLDVHFLQQDVLTLEEVAQKFDVIISNPPYVREMEKREMHRNVLEHEPHLALYVNDEDPLVFYRKITKLAAGGLNEKGNLYFEINQYLASETDEILRKNGFATQLHKDIFGNDRMLKGSRANTKIIELGE